MALSTEELLAVAVLRGDSTAIHGLLDELIANYSGAAKKVLATVQHVTVPKHRLKFVLFVSEFGEDYQFDMPGTQSAIRNWLDSNDLAEPLVLHGITGMNVYEMPEGESGQGS
jgi:hypothetical protein